MLCRWQLWGEKGLFLAQAGHAQKAKLTFLAPSALLSRSFSCRPRPAPDCQRGNVAIEAFGSRIWGDPGGKNASPPAPGGSAGPFGCSGPLGAGAAPAPASPGPNLAPSPQPWVHQTRTRPQTRRAPGHVASCARPHRAGRAQAPWPPHGREPTGGLVPHPTVARRQGGGDASALLPFKEAC